MPASRPPLPHLQSPPPPFSLALATPLPLRSHPVALARPFTLRRLSTARGRYAARQSISRRRSSCPRATARRWTGGPTASSSMRCSPGVPATRDSRACNPVHQSLQPAHPHYEMPAVAVVLYSYTTHLTMLTATRRSTTTTRSESTKRSWKARSSSRGTSTATPRRVTTRLDASTMHLP